MGRVLKKKGESGAAVTYVSRKQALKRLQLSLKDFRRLCILKGIYPVEPYHKKKANKNNSTNKTYYHLKDIQFLSHEPLIEKFRSFKVFITRLKRAIGKKDQETSHRLRENQPIINFDHIVKERYPSFTDALRDLDDALSMCFLFSTFPKSRAVKQELVQLCRRVTVEFMHYIMETKSLRKVFISIKGIYYQAEIMGELITWIIPHNLGFAHPDDVDFKIMVTFVTFYSRMLGFINYKLYNSINLIYPPKLMIDKPQNSDLLEGEEDNTEFMASLTINLKPASNYAQEEEVELDEFPEDAQNKEDLDRCKQNEEKIKKLKNLFKNCKIFLNREVPRESLVFIIRSCGGEVSFDKTLFVGATFDESDQTITHQIVDRPSFKKSYLNRYYIQPQWVYDSVNAGILLPVELYFIGEKLPPHLSPFVEEKEGDYIPPEKKALIEFQQGITKGIRKEEISSEDESCKSDDELSPIISREHSGSEDEKLKNLNKNTKRKLEKNDSKSEVLKKMKVTPGTFKKVDPIKLAQKEAAEEKKCATLLIPKKQKQLYSKIIFGQKRKIKETRKLKEKRENYNKEQKALKKKKKMNS